MVYANPFYPGTRLTGIWAVFRGNTIRLGSTREFINSLTTNTLFHLEQVKRKHEGNDTHTMMTDSGKARKSPEEPREKGPDCAK